MLTANWRPQHTDFKPFVVLQGELGCLSRFVDNQSEHEMLTSIKIVVNSAKKRRVSNLTCGQPGGSSLVVQ